MSGALIDTSVTVAGEEIADLVSEPVSISVITIGELHAGVLRARDAGERRRRVARLEAIRAAFEPLPVDEHVAGKYGELLAWARSNQRAEKATVLLIAATAAATGRRLFTLDQRQASIAEGAGYEVELLSPD